MTWTYDNTNLTSDLNQVRSAIGDIFDRVADGESLTDEEIQLRIGATSSLELAAVRAQEDRIARFAVIVNRSAAGVSSSQGDKLRGMKDLLQILKDRAGKGRMTVYAGGISQDRIDDAKEDTDYPPSAFSVGMDDKP